MMTHEYTIDHRFDEIHSRILSEFSWDSIVFEGRASIDTFLAEIKRLGFINILTLPFSYTDVPTLHYANKVGFRRSSITRNSYEERHGETMKGIVYVGHGSRLQEGNEQFIQFIQSVMKERNERIQK